MRNISTFTYNLILGVFLVFILWQTAGLTFSKNIANGDFDCFEMTAGFVIGHLTCCLRGFLFATILNADKTLGMRLIYLNIYNVWTVFLSRRKIFGNFPCPKIFEIKVGNLRTQLKKLLPRTCKELQVKSGVSSMCCRRRPGVQTTMLVFLILSCSCFRS